MADPHCSTAGNGDLYGIGVRLGLYLQWMAAFLLRNSTGSWKTVSVVRVANNGICLAIAIAMAIQAIEGSGLAIDYLLVYYLTIALFYSESYNLLDKGVTTPTTSRYSLVADVPLIVQNLLFAFMSFFGSWFWIAGISRAELTSCSTTAACILTFDVQALPWRIIAATLGTLTGIIFTVFLVVHALNLIPGNRQGPIVRRANAVVVKISRTKVVCAVSLGRHRSEFQYEWPVIQNHRWQSIVRPEDLLVHGFWRTNGLEMLHWILINLLGPVIAIVSVERMISANAITTDSIADSSGQLIALLTGIFAICVATSETAAKYLGNSKECQTGATDPAQYLLSRQAYCDPTPFSADQIAKATQGFVKLQYKRDPAFLDDLIGASPGALNGYLPQDYPLTVSNREIAYIKAERRYRISSNGQSYGVEAKYDDRDSIGWTPLLHAAFDGDINQLQLMLEEVKQFHPTNQRLIINAPDDYGRTPLWWAVAKAHVDVVKLLIQDGRAEFNSKDIQFQRTALALASLQGSATLVKMLLETCRVMVNTPNQEGQTPLSEAAGAGHLPVVQLLLARNDIEPNLPDRQGRGPLIAAAARGHTAIVSLLLERGANCDMRDRYRRTAVFYAAQYGHTEVLRVLDDHGREPDLHDQDDRTPLCWAAMHGQSSVISLLLSMGAAVNAVDRCGRTALCWAAIRGHAGAVDALLGVDGVEVDAQDMYLRTPLIWAAHNGHSSVVKLLMPKVNLDAKDKDGQTALSIATIMGHLDVNITLYDVGKNVELGIRPTGRRPVIVSSG